MGSILRFHDFTLLCPNERELRLALQDKDNGVEFLSRKLLKEKHCKKLLVKMGSDGFMHMIKIIKKKLPLNLSSSECQPYWCYWCGWFGTCDYGCWDGIRSKYDGDCCFSMLYRRIGWETLGNIPISISMINNYLDENFSYIEISYAMNHDFDFSNSTTSLLPSSAKKILSS